MNILMVVNNLRVANGVANVIMNQYDSLLQHDCKVDFIQFLDIETPFVEKIKRNGGKIITIKKNRFNIKTFYNIIKQGKYDVIHINQMNYYTVLMIILAKLIGIKNIVYHSHNTKIPGGLKRSILMKLCNIVYKKFANRYIACTDEAGRDAFGKSDYVILKNSIDVKKFKYDYKVRETYRKELKIKNDTFVVGTVCRFANQKNPMFMLEIIKAIKKINENILFLWVGSAPYKEDPIVKRIKDKIKECELENNVLLVGSKEDVYKWYSIMDAFLMPSLWEGLGISFIEAQANSLPTFASDVVPKDTEITPLIKFISLDEDVNVWAKEICKNKVRTKKSEIVNYKLFEDAGYDMKEAKNDLYNIYINFK